MALKFNPFTGNFELGSAGGGGNEPEYNAGNSGSAITINWAKSISQALTLTANCTISFSGGVSGAIHTLRLIQDGTGSRTVVYSPLTGTGKIIPQAATFPTLTSTANFVDFMQFYYDGTYYYLLNPDKNYSPLDFANNYSTTFDGVSKYVTFGNNISHEYNSVFSISFWVKISGNGGIITKEVTSPSLVGMEIFNSGGSIDFGFFGNGTSAYVTTNAALTTGVWHHVVVTTHGTDATGFKIYVDGSAVAITVSANTISGATTNTAPFCIACRNAASDFFNGKVDEVSVWNIELSATQVTQIYNSGTPTNLLAVSFASNLTNWYRMGDSPDTTSTFYDRQGSVNGTPTNIVAADITTDVP